MSFLQSHLAQLQNITNDQIWPMTILENKLNHTLLADFVSKRVTRWMRQIQKVIHSKFTACSQRSPPSLLF